MFPETYKKRKLVQKLVKTQCNGETVSETLMQLLAQFTESI